MRETIQNANGKQFHAVSLSGGKDSTAMHIEKVMDGIRENTTRVWNTKAYLMAALFNSVSTIDNHYAMLVNHDFHGGP